MGAYADEIRAERERHAALGYTAEHDDAHDDGSLLRAARIYAVHGTPLGVPTLGGVPVTWPWSRDAGKPKDHRRNLVRAGALCIAEHDRLERCGKAVSPEAAAVHRLFAGIMQSLARWDDGSLT
jgi:hypothetical protein